MNKILLFALFIVMMVAPASFALDLGYSGGSSHYGDNTPGVTTQTDSFHLVGIIGSGSATGSNYAGGQALTTTINPVSAPTGEIANDWNATQNSGEAIGGFNYSIQTGNKNFLGFIPPMAGAIAGTKGDVSQESTDGSYIPGVNGAAGSLAVQESEAGFIGADADLLFGKNKGPVLGSFTGDSVVVGETYSYSYNGQNGATDYIGTVSGAWNLAGTTITGGVGSDYAGGDGRIVGGSYITTPNASTNGQYGGQFSFTGNGAGSVVGYSESFRTLLTNGAVVGTRTGISVNVI